MASPPVPVTRRPFLSTARPPACLTSLPCVRDPGAAALEEYLAEFEKASIDEANASAARMAKAKQSAAAGGEAAIEQAQDEAAECAQPLPSPPPP